MYRYFLIFIAVLICILGLSFHLKNDQLVSLNYYLGSFEYYFSVYILVSIIIGVMLGIILTLPKLLLLKQENKKLLRQIDIKDKEVNNLRTLPIKDEN